MAEFFSGGCTVCNKPVHGWYPGAFRCAEHALGEHEASFKAGVAAERSRVVETLRTMANLCLASNPGDEVVKFQAHAVRFAASEIEREAAIVPATCGKPVGKPLSSGATFCCVKPPEHDGDCADCSVLPYGGA